MNRTGEKKLTLTLSPDSCCISHALINDHMCCCRLDYLNLHYMYE